MTSRKRHLMKRESVPLATPPVLLEDLRRMIEEARQGVAATVNAALTLLYWRIGKRISEEILKGEQAEYGEQILATLSQELVRDYGNGFGEKNLHIVVSLIRQLSWTHFKESSVLNLPYDEEPVPDARHQGRLALVFSEEAEV